MTNSRICDYCFKPAVTHRRLLRNFFLRTNYCQRHEKMFVLRTAKAGKPIHIDSAEASFPIQPELPDFVRNAR